MNTTLSLVPALTTLATAFTNLVLALNAHMDADDEATFMSFVDAASDLEGALNAADADSNLRTLSDGVGLAPGWLMAHVPHGTPTAGEVAGALEEAAIRVLEPAAAFARLSLAVLHGGPEAPGSGLLVALMGSIAPALLHEGLDVLHLWDAISEECVFATLCEHGFDLQNHDGESLLGIEPDVRPLHGVIH